MTLQILNNTDINDCAYCKVDLKINLIYDEVIDNMVCGNCGIIDIQNIVHNVILVDKIKESNKDNDLLKLVGPDVWDIINDFKIEMEEYEEELYNCEECGELLEEEYFKESEYYYIRWFKGLSFCGGEYCECYGKYYEREEEELEEKYKKMKVKELKGLVKEISLYNYEECGEDKIKYYNYVKCELVEYLVSHYMEDRY